MRRGSKSFLIVYNAHKVQVTCSRVLKHDHMRVIGEGYERAIEHISNSIRFKRAIHTFMQAALQCSSQIISSLRGMKKSHDSWKQRSRCERKKNVNGTFSDDSARAECAQSHVASCTCFVSNASCPKHTAHALRIKCVAFALLIALFAA